MITPVEILDLEKLILVNKLLPHHGSQPIVAGHVAVQHLGGVAYITTLSLPANLTSTSLNDRFWSSKLNMPKVRNGPRRASRLGKYEPLGTSNGPSLLSGRC